MALKGDRTVVQTEIGYFMSQVAERGGVCSLVTGGSGVALDQSLASVAYVAANSLGLPNASGLSPIGLLLCDVVNLDLTRQHINFHKDEVQYGGKVSLLQKGVVTTNYTSGVNNIAVAGLTAFLGPYGRVTHLRGNTPATTDVNTPVVGRFLSNPDENGFVKLQVNL